MRTTSSVNGHGKLKAFTLIELLVVVAIIALLISILLPSLSKARAQAAFAACGTQAQQISLALRMYQDEHGGCLPPYLWSESAWNVPKRDLWFYKLTPKYLVNEKALICPGDPHRATFDYDKYAPGASEPRTDTTVPACGWGMNYFLRHAGAMNPEKSPPRWPSKTILLAEVGPDTDLKELPLMYGNVDVMSTAEAWRDGGRLLWNDASHMGYSGPTWLTARHVGNIDMIALDGHVQRVNTVKQLKHKVQNPYNGLGGSSSAVMKDLGDCMGLTVVGGARRYVCMMCGKAGTPEASGYTHYNFAKQNLWWWTGPQPNDPAYGSW